MLSLLTCVSDPALCNRLVLLAIQACHEAQLDCESLLRTANAAEAIRTLCKLDEPCLSTFEIAVTGEMPAVITSICTATNRPEHMLMVLLEDLCVLAAMINAGAKPDGVLIKPVDNALAHDCFLRIAKNYQSQRVNDAKSVTLHFGRKTYHLPLRSIVYLEALDKKVNVYTQLQCVTVSDSLHEVLSQLDELFIQCHRSYVVNSDAVRLADYPRMQLCLSNGVRIPISRNGRRIVEERLGNAGEC